jgi:hypothetical protein
MRGELAPDASCAARRHAASCDPPALEKAKDRIIAALAGENPMCSMGVVMSTVRETRPNGRRARVMTSLLQARSCAVWRHAASCDPPALEKAKNRSPRTLDRRESRTDHYELPIWTIDI